MERTFLVLIPCLLITLFFTGCGPSTEPATVPIPAPTPAPVTNPAPTPAPAPKPVIEPTPALAPETTPAPAPEPELTPEPESVPEPEATIEPTPEEFNIDSQELPQFVGCNYIELDAIQRISRFRSSEGHDYSDAFESCRSMKHYFQPKDNTDWSKINIYSPVEGVIVRITTETFQEAGKQIIIQSSEYPDYYFIIFHVNLEPSLAVGDTVMEGEPIGTHVGDITMSDIAVGVETQQGYRLVSYFEVMNDALFQLYQERGLESRSDIIISKEERDADSLECIEEQFKDKGSLENWVNLN